MSARCFDRQTFPQGDRELLIINGGKPLNIKSNYVRELLVKQDDMTLGDLRNIAIEEAAGEYLIQWDDDDWHHPERCSRQFEAFSKRKDGCCLLTRQIRCDFITEDSFRLYWSFGIPGTILHHKKCPFRYPSIKVSEDSEFHKKFEGNVSLLNDADLYCRFYHSLNTWDRKHIMGAAGGSDWNSESLRSVLNTQVFPEFHKYMVKGL